MLKSTRTEDHLVVMMEMDRASRALMQNAAGDKERLLVMHFDLLRQVAMRAASLNASLTKSPEVYENAPEGTTIELLIMQAIAITELYSMDKAIRLTEAIRSIIMNPED